MIHINVPLDDDAHRDPMSGATGAHPIGAGIGATVGAVVVGLSGKGVSDAIDPTREAAYWREHYSDCPYVEPNSSYSDYGPACAFGVDAFGRNPGHTFDGLESVMSRQWMIDGGASTLRWDRAKPAVRDAWSRVSRTT